MIPTRLRAARHQAAGECVGDVADVVRGPADALKRRRRHRAGAVQHLADRLEAHPRPPRHVLERRVATLARERLAAASRPRSLPASPSGPASRPRSLSPSVSIRPSPPRAVPAGAGRSCAGSGGQPAPPVMGSSAIAIASLASDLRRRPPYDSPRHLPLATQGCRARYFDQPMWQPRDVGRPAQPRWYKPMSRQRSLISGIGERSPPNAGFALPHLPSGPLNTPW